MKDIDELQIISNIRLAKAIFEWWSQDLAIEFEFDVLEVLFKIDQEPDKKILILLMYFDKLDQSQIKVLTEFIGVEYKKLFIAYQKPKFKKSDKTLELLSKLEKVKMISSFREDKKSIRAYPFGTDR